MKENEALKYPILMVHGMGFRDSKWPNYWGRIPKMYSKWGNKVFYGNQDSNATIEDNALVLQKRIDEILSETLSEKVNIIAHSKGGMEARYLISTLGYADKIASLTTISTPHHGSKFLDKIPDWILAFCGFFSDLWMRICGDKKPNAYKAFKSLRRSYAEEFNKMNPDSELVYYQSYSFVMHMDILMWLPHLVISIFEGENDGLLTPEGTHWTNNKLVKSNSRRGISHFDEVDGRRMRFTRKTGDGISDILEVYKDAYDSIKNKGF